MAKQKGKGTPHFDEGEKAALVEAICSIYESQHCTLESACQASGISPRTFFLWKSQNSEFAERYKKAKAKQQEHYWEDIIQPLAETAFQRLLKGETKTETKTEEGAGPMGPIKKEVVTKSELLPNATVTIFAMKGLHPERFVERLEHSGKGGEPIKFENLTTEEKKHMLYLAEKAANSNSA